MTELFVQDIVVTVVALAAASVVAWRVFSVVQPSQAPTCANCPSAKAHARKPSVAQPAASAQPIASIRR